MIYKSIQALCIIICLLSGCVPEKNKTELIKHSLPANVLNYAGMPTNAKDRTGLAFSDQGAWFAYGLPDDAEYYGGFSGPFLMTQENGVWCSKSLSQLKLSGGEGELDWQDFSVTQRSYNSHLEQSLKNEQLHIRQVLFFSAAHTALLTTAIQNLSNQNISLQAKWQGSSFLKSLKFTKEENNIKISSTKSKAIGHIALPGAEIVALEVKDSSYAITLENINLKPGEKKTLLLTQSFSFSQNDITRALQHVTALPENYPKLFEHRIRKKEQQLEQLSRKGNPNYKDSVYQHLRAKAVLTLQNNWRIPAGELKHAGLFPSYHYIWFHGFWAWDSWKHAAALAQYQVPLAKAQIRAMYDFKDEKGFIADCVFRDTAIENHNYRNTKPPLSAWATWLVFEQDQDTDFLEELYPKIVAQHDWWYSFRDHDKDGICEYGSTDGTLIAAKWESGMDNAVRFDKSSLLKNSEGAWSLNQESVDLNAYLFAEKMFLVKMARALAKNEDATLFKKAADALKSKIQTQFFDEETAWFYDTSLDGKSFIKVMGCEGWIPLWASAATPEQAAEVKNNMMNPAYFNTKVPFQTLSASHPAFKPEGGYWRGPTWLDQAYFGVKGLRNFGFQKEADEITYKLMHHADGVLPKGRSIRENYNPVTGKGLEAENFSWSAAHYLLLLD